MITLIVILYLIVSIGLSVEGKSLIGFAVIPGLLLAVMIFGSVVLVGLYVICYIVSNFP